MWKAQKLNWEGRKENNFFDHLKHTKHYNFWLSWWLPIASICISAPGFLWNCWWLLCFSLQLVGNTREPASLESSPQPAADGSWCISHLTHPLTGIKVNLQVSTMVADFKTLISGISCPSANRVPWTSQINHLHWNLSSRGTHTKIL